MYIKVDITVCFCTCACVSAYTVLFKTLVIILGVDEIFTLNTP